MADVVRENRIFEKRLSASDVSRNQSRLMIPKEAKKMIALLELNEGVNPSIGTTVEFIDLDEPNRVWPFRFKKWRSSGSYVLIEGWNKFVHLRNLQEGSRVAVDFCDDNAGSAKFYILVCPCTCLALDLGHVHGNPHFCGKCGGRRL